MLKMAKSEEATIKDDPKLLERPVWQRMKIAADHEACHSDWSSAFYRLHRTGKIDNDQREAGDKYASLIRDYRKLWVDPVGQIEVYRRDDDFSAANRSPAIADVTWALGMVAGEAVKEESEFETKRAQRISKKYKEARAIAAPVANILEDLLVNDIWPVCHNGHREISHALTRLSHFFATGTKRVRGQ